MPPRPTPPPERRMTRQRETILEIVRTSHSHPDAEEVYRLAKKKIPAISLGTVYRNLKLLAEEGAILEVSFFGGASRFDGMLEAHEHFYCKSCGGVQDLKPTLRDRDIAKHSTEIEGVVEQYKLDYYGLCTKCAAKSKANVH